MSLPRSDRARKNMLIELIASYAPKEHRKRALNSFTVFGPYTLTRMLLDVINGDRKPWDDWKIEDTQ